MAIDGGTSLEGIGGAIPFGILWTDKHAICCFVDDERQFWYIEPQNNAISDKLEEWQGSVIRFISI